MADFRENICKIKIDARGHAHKFSYFCETKLFDYFCENGDMWTNLRQQKDNQDPKFRDLSMQKSVKH